MPTFREVEKLFYKHLAVDTDPHYLRVIFGTVIANRLDTLPVWLLVIGTPSSGKSEVVTSLSTAPDMYPMSCINKNSLISHAPKKGREDEDDEHSLLPRLNNKILMITDMSTLSTMHPNDKMFIFGQLRSAFDGELSRATGMGQKVFKSKFGFIGCATPFFEYQKTFEGALGERFLYYRPSVCSDEDVYAKVRGNKHAYSNIKMELMDSCKQFFLECKTPARILYSDEIMELAQSLAILRTESIRSQYGDREKVFPSIPEKPIRLTKQLSALFTGIRSIASERDALQAVKKVIKNTIPYVRLEIMKAIISGMRTSSDIRTIIHVSDAEIKRQIEDLVDLGVLSQAIKPGKSANFTINPTFENIMKIGPLL